MSALWHSLSDLKYTSLNTIEADASIGPDSLWFNGHFPDEPILPGIALLSMVVQTIKQYEHEKGNRIKISELKRVRFRQIVHPGDSILLSITKENDKDFLYTFKLIVNNEVACKGLIAAEVI